MSADKLSDALWVDPVKKPEKSEDRLAEALQKALDRTTPERAGAPWDGELSGDSQLSEAGFERGIADSVETPPLMESNIGNYKNES
jgi:hypothetical protein